MSCNHERNTNKSCFSPYIIYTYTFSLAAKPPRKQALAASRQVNHVFLALYLWWSLLGGQPPRIIFLAVLVYSLAVLARQSNSSLV